MDQDFTYLDDYKEPIAKTVRAEIKAGLQPSFYIWETDQQVFQGSWPAYTIVYKVQTQEAMKDHHKDKSNAKGSVPFSTKDSKPSDKVRKNKKRKQYRDRRDFTNPTTRVNKAEVSGRKKKNISKITCYNCNKKRHFATKCLKSWKSKN